MTHNFVTLATSLILFINGPKVEFIETVAIVEEEENREAELLLISANKKSLNLILSKDIQEPQIASKPKVNHASIFMVNEKELLAKTRHQTFKTKVTLTFGASEELVEASNTTSKQYEAAHTIQKVGVVQDNPVTGKVFAFKDTPVKNIRVTAKKSKETVLTDEQGNFTIDCAKNDKLVFEGSGFRKEVVKVVDGQLLKVKMLFLTGEKNEEALVGAGHMSKESLFFSKSNFLEYNNDFHTYQDVFMLIAGKFPGVKIYTELGEKRVVIRDISYLSGRDNTALYLVDGQIWQDISVLTPEEIVSIDILKDGSPLGFRAVNGVVVISTVAHADKSGGN